MARIWSLSDPQACRKVWEATIPQVFLTDLWDVRKCFHDQYQRHLNFVVAEEAGQIIGLLPLAWIPETSSYGYFPGEIWHGGTWLEQNRIIAKDQAILSAMIDHLEERASRFSLRYLTPSPLLQNHGTGVDEDGYLFHPPRFEFSMDGFFASFSSKARKKILKVVDQFEARGTSVRLDDFADFELMVRMNLERYQDESYFADSKFAQGFKCLAKYLQSKGWLRMTTILVEGKPAAVDMGSIFNNVYTLLAGGTDPEFMGIAKYINLYHMRRACKERLNEVDFLCGDFGWKPLFHLTPRPLYKMGNFDVGTDLMTDTYLATRPLTGSCENLNG